MKLLIVVINHSHNAQAIALKETLSPHASVIAIDSGSELSAKERAGFDLCLPNVYFGGCVKSAVACALRGGYTHLWIWASDVGCDRPAEAVRRCTCLLSLPFAGVYAPSATDSFHRQMAPRAGSGLSRVSFTDGFCFAARVDLFQQVAHDFRGDKFGFGIDIHLGYLARLSGLGVYVDHRYRVTHPLGAGYSVNHASEEWQRWRWRQPLGTHLFHVLARKRISKTALGMRILLSLPWGLGMRSQLSYRAPWPKRPASNLSGIPGKPREQGI